VVALLACFVVVQVAASTRWGVETGRSTHSQHVNAARTIVNLDRLSSAKEQSLIEEYVFPVPPYVVPLIVAARHDGLTVFHPPAWAYYRRLGPPTS